jgi:hypothetical protein
VRPENERVELRHLVAPALVFATLCAGCARELPTFVVEAFREASKTCAEAGGRLMPAERIALRAIDVNDDGTQELTFALDRNVTCEGAWSVFSCGSLGCPTTLYERHDGAWRAIASIDTAEAESIERGSVERGGYRDLIVPRGTAEHAFYEWQGAQYELVYLRVRGIRVEFAKSEHGLRNLARGTDLLATPSRVGDVLGHYEAGTEVALVGTAEGDYLYVSPCNACESGFVPASALTP